MAEAYFSEGAEVEVSSDDEGFRDAWFAATVIYWPLKSSLKRKRRLLVEYQTLLDDEGGSKPLREYVDASYVRPRPPPVPTDHTFELNEVVDAYHNDGWWRGVIAKVLDDSRFSIFFHYSNEEIEFEKSDLRVHLEWTDGKWFRPENQGMMGLKFSGRTPVEVSLNDENFHGVWFHATVLERIKEDSFIVEYQRPMLGADAGLIKQTVDYLHIRPSSPHTSMYRSFHLLEKVDAFFDFGWWTGVIVKVLAGMRFSVYFRCRKEHKEFDHSELRPHMDWNEGKWVQTSLVGNTAQPSEIPNQLESPDMASYEAKQEQPSSVINSSKKTTIQSMPNKEKSPYNAANSSKKKVMHSTIQWDSELSRPDKKLKKEETMKCSISLKAFDIYPAKSIRAKAKHAATPTMESKGTSHPRTVMFDDQHLVMIGSPDQEKQPASPSLAETFLNHSSGCNVDNPMPTNLGEEEQVEIVRDKLAQKVTSHNMECNGSVNQLSVGKSYSHPQPDSNSINLFPNFMQLEKAFVNCGYFQLHWQRKMLAKRSRRGPQKRKYLVFDTEIDLQKIEGRGKETVRLPKKRGRPPKKRVGGTGPSTKDKEPNAPERMGHIVQNIYAEDIEMPIEVSEMSDSQANGRLYPNEEHLKLIRDEEHLSDSVRCKKVVDDVTKVPLEKKGQNEDTIAKGQPIALDVISSTQGHYQASGEEKVHEVTDAQIVSEEADISIGGLSINILEEKPLWTEQCHAPTNSSGALLDHQPVSQPKGAITRTTDQCGESGDLEGGTVLLSCTAVPTCNDVLVENQSLPFVKSSPIWEMIESMKIFHLVPQKPHFHPLDQCNEELREGLAIGYMVAFASLVQKTSKLRLDNPRSDFEKMLDALVYFGTYGFTVQPVRECVNKMLKVKDRKGNLVDKSTAIESEINKWNDENERINKEIDDVCGNISKIEETLCILRKKRESMMAQKKMNESSIDALQTQVDGINRDIQDANFVFDSQHGQLLGE